MNRVFVALAVGCVAGTALAQLGNWLWLGELASHFPVQALIVAFITLPVMARDGRYGLVVLLLAAAALNARPLLPYLDRGQSATAEGFDFAAVNLRGGNRNSERFERWLADAQPHVVALAELNHRHTEAMNRLDGIYPARSMHPGYDNFGIGLMSRFPIVTTERFYLGDVSPAIAAEIQTPDGVIDVIAIHLRPPISPNQAARRNQQLVALAELAAERRHPLVILGDFNTTPYSPKLQRLLADGGLADTSRGRGISYTWPRGLPLFRVPIDLCLVSTEFEVLNQRLGPAIGSDHWPLVTSLAL